MDISRHNEVDYSLYEVDYSLFSKSRKKENFPILISLLKQKYYADIKIIEQYRDTKSFTDWSYIVELRWGYQLPPLSTSWFGARSDQVHTATYPLSVKHCYRIYMISNDPKFRIQKNLGRK